MGLENTTARENLGFKDSVLKNFDFLTSEYSFKCIDKDIYCVKFKSSSVQLDIFHERISYEIYFELRLKRGFFYKEYATTLEDLLELSGVLKTTSVFYQASSIDSVNEAVSQIAELVKKYAKNALRGNITTFKKLQVIKEERTEILLKQEKMKELERKASEAWIIKDYEEVYKLYLPYESQLSDVQRKKLEYARSRTN